ncbi:MAG: hypothetical protein DRJ33_03845 [Candidatus Methanomethylicota archaeon]|uniref:Uncharacterized protein n=1 Tax=Thermoproteota archaeon TaxID=2056631 RepID=A0A497EYI5_9CREN|nr:MAG: hypothetical protein DRJ33_03845 [Candidatus Verstraetearchaeota archaeon]
MSWRDLLAKAKHEVDRAAKAVEGKANLSLILYHVNESYDMLTKYLSVVEDVEARDVLGKIEEVKRLISQYALMIPCQSSLPSVVFGESSIPSIALSMILDKLKQVKEKLSKLR